MSPPGSLRIAVDGLPLCVRSAGVATYTRELLAALAEQLDAEIQVFCPPWPRPRFPDTPSRLRLRRSPAYPLVMEHPLPSLAGLLQLEAALGEVDVFHSTAYALPRRRRCPVVCTVHDLALLRYPHLGTAPMRSLVERTVAQLAEVDMVIAVSQATRDDLIELGNVDPQRVRVVYNGVAPHFQPISRSAPATPYVLHVGTIEPRKNLANLMRGFAIAIARENLPHHLVLAGADGWGDEDLPALAAQLGIADRIDRRGWVDPTQLPDLYGSAAVFAYPSLYEGFGLPVLEAMACGTPVLTSDRGALAEVAGSAALLCNPNDPESIARGLTEILTDRDRAATLTDRGRERASQFSWTRCATETLRVYRDLT